MKKKIMSLMVVFCLVGLMACNSEENISEEDNIVKAVVEEEKEVLNKNHLSFEIVENVSINAEVKDVNLNNCKSYAVQGKSFNIDEVANALNIDISGYEKQTNPNGTYVDNEQGGCLFIRNGGVDYTETDKTDDILFLVETAYMKELNYENENENIENFLEEDIVKNTKEIVSEIFKGNDNESLQLLAATKVKMNDLLKTQENEINSGEMQTYIDLGVSQEIEQGAIEEESYYLIFGNCIDGIHVYGSQEEGVRSASEDLVMQATTIKVLVDTKGIHYLCMEGAFSLEEIEENDIFSAKETCDF